MAAFETHWRRFSFDPNTKTFQESDNARKSEITIDHDQLAEVSLRDTSFGFSPIDGGGYLCSESCSSASREVRDLEEAKRFAASLVESWNLDHWEDEIGHALDSEALIEHQRQHIEVAKQRIMEMVESAWEDFQADPE